MAYSHKIDLQAELCGAIYMTSVDLLHLTADVCKGIKFDCAINNSKAQRIVAS